MKFIELLPRFGSMRVLATFLPVKKKLIGKFTNY